MKDKKTKHREYMREYNKTEKGKLYNRKHVKEWRKRTKTPHSRVRKQNSAAYREIIIGYLIERDGINCGFCAASLEGSKIHIDHKIPVALGGKNIMENMRLSHPSCNMEQALIIRKESHGY